MRSNLRLCSLVMGVLLIATVAAAHHPNSGLFDESKEFTLHGIVRSIAYVEPHVILQLEAVAGGATYFVVLPSPLSLETNGLPKGTLRVGMALSVVASPGVNDPGVLLPEHLEFGGVVYQLNFETTPGGATVHSR